MNALKWQNKQNVSQHSRSPRLNIVSHVFQHPIHAHLLCISLSLRKYMTTMKWLKKAHTHSSQSAFITNGVKCDRIYYNSGFLRNYVLQITHTQWRQQQQWNQKIHFYSIVCSLSKEHMVYWDRYCCRFFTMFTRLFYMYYWYSIGA